MFDLVQERDIGKRLSPRTIVYVMTHAESTYDSLAELTENGRRQAFELAHSRVATGVFAVFTSPAMASVSTAKELEKEFGVLLESVEELANIKLGMKKISKEDLVSVLPRLWKDPEWAPDEGESLMSARRRMSDYMSRLVETHKNVGIAIVTHPILAVLFDTLVLGGLPEVGDWLSMGYCSCAAYEYSNDGWTLVSPHDNSFLTQPSAVRDTLPDEILQAVNSS